MERSNESPEPEASQPSAADGNDRTCLFIHRTAMVMVDGENVACGNFFAANTGHLARAESFAEIWNGPSLVELRQALNTPQEPDLCRTCWYREVRYHSNRQLRETGSEPELERTSRHVSRSWDFRRFKREGEGGQ